MPESRARRKGWAALLILCLSTSSISDVAVGAPNAASFDDAASHADLWSAAYLPKQSCPSMVRESQGSLTIIDARLIAAGGSQPEHCMVRGMLTADSRFALYLPSRWSGRLYMYGNGGDAGEEVDDPALASARVKALRLGFAVIVTDMGHNERDQPGATWAYHNLGALIDYGYRATHEAAVQGKELAVRYYGEKVRSAYFDGCSTGGRQGLIEAQRFPDDFDGILAGAPVQDLTHMLWQYQRNQLLVDRTPVTPDLERRLADYLFDRYDANDGVRDGVIGDPLAVRFDPERELPSKGAGAKGFSPEEIDLIDQIYAPLLFRGAQVFPAAPVGSERQAPVLDRATGRTAPLSGFRAAIGPDPSGAMIHRAILESWFRYMAFPVGDPQRDWTRLTIDNDLPKMELFTTIADAVDPNLSPFQQKGGKLIVYHGWSDFDVNGNRSVQYYRDVEKSLGRDPGDFMQLYMIPGMMHCRGGLGIDHFDLMTALVAWREKGQAPEKIVGSRKEYGKVVAERPLCAFPSVAHYKGSGDPDSARSFVCRAPATH